MIAYWGIGLYCHQSDVSKLPQVISDHCKRINTELNIVTAGVFLATPGFKLKKTCNFLSFCQIFMIILPKCRAFYVVLAKGHGAGKRACHDTMLKLARGNTKSRLPENSSDKFFSSFF